MEKDNELVGEAHLLLIMENIKSIQVTSFSSKLLLAHTIFFSPNIQLKIQQAGAGCETVPSHVPHHLQYTPLWAIWKSLLAMLQPCGYKNMEKADDGG